eukprot:TRINITY_DN5149_c0_g1_i1.p1 TRINITY_DN5149_c0_g1~~TRINITY_DN5149_c0_g1_i1.p1  ORF type:complete len:722 (-),score=188.85 TRINITY_DN5149_c0_g1_i1:293-2458(-)
MAAVMTAGPERELEAFEDATRKLPVGDLARDMTLPSEEDNMLYSLHFMCPLLSFLPVVEQLPIICTTSRSLRTLFQPEDPSSECWQNLCLSLCHQRKLHLPRCVREQSVLVQGRGGWKTLFEELWALRNRFVNDVQEQGRASKERSEKFRLATFCRFRPASSNAAAAATAAAAAASSSAGSVALPLHQRLALLRQSHPELSTKQAMKIIMAKQETDNTEDSTGAKEQAAGGARPGLRASVMSMEPGFNGSVLTVSPGCGLRAFDFDAVLDGKSTQREVYETCGLRLVTDLVNGVNGALLVYGQTGSGKTHTMFGGVPTGGAAEDVTQGQSGLAVRVADAALAALAERRASFGVQGDLSVSYVEVFGNDVVDLLEDPRTAAPRSRSGVGSVMAHRHVLEGFHGRMVSTREELAELLVKGDARKRKASTSMNQSSTRAHTILIMRLVQTSAEQTSAGEPPVVSALFLADLGGSERVTKSNANADVKAPGGFVSAGQEIAKVESWSEYYRCRERITETNFINKGLLSLKRCISALHERQLQKTSSGGQAVAVPFRESKLTAILEPALGGLSRASIIVCCAPEEYHAEETVQSLRFGEMCRRIQHVQKITADPANAITKALKSIDEEVEEVEAEIQRKERWEWRQTKRTDLVDANDEATTKVQSAEEMELGGFGAVEFLAAGDSARDTRTVEHTVWGQHLVGAEEERARLEALLEQRRRLLGEAA